MIEYNNKTWKHVLKAADILFLRCLPIVLSLYTCSLVRADHQAREENLQVNLTPIFENYETSMVDRTSGVVSPYYMNLRYKVELINNSDRALSVLSTALFLVTEDGSVQYLEMDQGLFTDTGTKPKYPLNIDPGKGVSFTQVVGLNVRPEIAEAIKTICGEGKPFGVYSMHDRIMKYVQDKKGTCSTDGADIVDSRYMAKPMKFSFLCRTGRKNTFSGYFTQYI